MFSMQALPTACRVHQLFAALDLNGDGVIGRHEMLAAFRANRQLADFMRMPAKIQASLQAATHRIVWACTLQTLGVAGVC
jgi:hypothetical protein